MRPAYYNELDKGAAAWLRELIKAGHIAPGDVDERSIEDVEPQDLRGYGQVHLFSGIGVWSAAFRLAGIPDDRPFWSASCPCQDFSVAGKGQGMEGERDLWDDTFRLIRECHPDAVFGEQVGNAVGFGWLDRLGCDLESEAYAVGQAVLGAHSVGADHRRQRLYWVANSRRGQREQRSGAQGDGVSGLADHGDERGGMADLFSERGRSGNGERQHAEDAESRCFDLWHPRKWHHCRDGKQRRIPTEPGLFPLVTTGDHKGYRVAALRGAGNAICLGTAAAFIEASMQAIEDTHEGDE